ncbi:MAG: glycosyltransferase 61 family protein [Acetobacteraceae bacterium]
MPSDTSELPIAEIAHEVVVVDPGAPVAAGAEIDLGDTFTEPAIRRNFERVEHHEAAHLFRMHDITLFAPHMLLFHGRRPIRETRYLVSDEEFAYAQAARSHSIAQDPGEHFIIGSNRVWRNYFHWLIQAVPAIDWSLRHAIHRRPTLVLWPLQPWHEETLDLLGWREERRLVLEEGHDTYHLPSAEFSDFLGSEAPYRLSRASMMTFRRMAQGVPWSRGTAEAIYVARTDTQNRVAANEAEVIDLMQRQGVQVVVPGTLSVREQIATFRSARLVIGPHGAGMSNIAFCESGSFVYEMLPRHFPNAVFGRLAQAAGLNYWADLFDSHGEGHVHERGWRVDLDLVARRLDALRARMAATPRTESAMGFLRRTQAAHPDDLEAQAAGMPAAARAEAALPAVAMPVVAVPAVTVPVVAVPAVTVPVVAVPAVAAALPETPPPDTLPPEAPAPRRGFLRRLLSRDTADQDR